MISLLLMLMNVLTDGGAPPPPTSGIYLDFANLSFWQWLGGVIVLLGISPAPWITALATGRLLFRADLNARLAVAKENYEKSLQEAQDHHDELMTVERERYSLLERARDTERERNEKLTDALEDSTRAVEATTSVLLEIRSATKRAIG
jgi:hypothetical protein